MKKLNRKEIRQELLKELRSIKESADLSDLHMKDIGNQTVTDFSEYENTEVLGETITSIWEVLDGLWKNQEIILKKVQDIERKIGTST